MFWEDGEERSRLVQLAYSVHWTNEWDLVLFPEPEGVEFVHDGTRNEELKVVTVFKNMELRYKSERRKGDEKE